MFVMIERSLVEGSVLELRATTVPSLSAPANALVSIKLLALTACMDRNIVEMPTSMSMSDLLHAMPLPIPGPQVISRSLRRRRTTTSMRSIS